MSRVLAIDRGNCAVKGSLIEDGMIVSRWKGEGTEEDIASWAEESKPDGAAVSSVVIGWNGTCEKALRRMGVENIIFAEHDSPWPFVLDIDTPDTIGPDRLCAAAGVACEGTTEAVIIDAGTAVTVDFLTDGRFVGGAIMPGLDMMLKSLSEGTSALPRIHIAPGTQDAPLGRDTASAITAGVLAAYSGGVEKLLKDSKCRFGNLPDVFLTGGDAGHLVDRISMTTRHYPDLVLQGLNCLYDRQF